MPEGLQPEIGQQNTSEVMLATLLHLMRRAREAASAASLRFVLVNESHALLPYRQAALWTSDQGVEALSGVSAVERQAPYVHWLERWCKQADSAATGAAGLDLRSLSGSDEWAGWQEWLPPFLAVIPLPSRDGFAGGRLVLAREKPFTPAELSMLQEWCDAWVQAYAALQPRRWLHPLHAAPTAGRKKRWLIRSGVVLAIALISVLPVRLTVLAPAELVPLDPAIIRAPMDGIIDDVLVSPNQRVASEQPLFAFDRVSLASRLEVAERSLTTIQAEYRRNAQRALFDPESKSELAVLQSQIAERQVEVEYLRELNQRSQVPAPREGVVLFEDAGDLIGRPVVTGERIMVVADEHKTQVEAWVSPADMVNLLPGNEVKLYLAADPVNPVSARISYVAHLAEQRPDGQFAYRVRAQLDEQGQPSTPRVGLKGTAKLEGETVSLIYWVLRRPWSGLRGWIGL
ncbi:efflux RND transporter periplasmic adaptor subunit [Marinobacterium sediminicola]|uniref:HlyD family secretion protein n=1 Tax=Marinobacterium sediminicola TaxID=518898 RepID=A0ABY1RWE6_9GAMM|nr:HlyD family efflux transporter periplasmic adaptor subunit [Marinobacterium sediminicola]ULG70374.1 HlyD family efflux transporter periplasmic adaptor subunit [Marinobacterium sediminicola]SMR69575.1 HlyD family secretion protein [Marinobacterium sediminicola]